MDSTNIRHDRATQAGYPYLAESRWPIGAVALPRGELFGVLSTISAVTAVSRSFSARFSPGLRSFYQAHRNPRRIFWPVLALMGSPISLERLRIGVAR